MDMKEKEGERGKRERDRIGFNEGNNSGDLGGLERL